MDFTEAELAAISAALVDGLRASPRGHQPTMLERMATHAKYRQMREQHYGPLSAGERMSGPRNSLAQESLLTRKIFGL